MTAEAIKKWRTAQRLTQVEMANLLGLQSGGVTISSWESGRSSPQPYLDLALVELTRRLDARRRQLEQMEGAREDADPG